MLTLWDLLRPNKRRPMPRSTAPTQRPAEPRPNSMRSKYDALVRESLAEHGVRVRKWRSSMSGVAWEVRYADGRTARLIESPRPKGPMSAAVFCHEIGHHAIGFNVYSPRCLEEYMAWRWAIEEKERRGLNVSQRVRTRMLESMRYAVRKSHRRGLRTLPRDVAQYLRANAAPEARLWAR